MTQAQDLASLGNYGTPQDYYNATGQFYEAGDPNYGQPGSLVDSQGRPWVSNDVSGPPMMLVDAEHATAQYPAGSLVPFNSPDRQAVYRDMPQTGLLGDLKIVAPALLGAAGGIAGGLAGLGGAVEGGVGAGSLTGGAGADTLGSGLWSGAIDAANTAGLGTAAGGIPGITTAGLGTAATVAGAANTTNDFLNESEGLNTSAPGTSPGTPPWVDTPPPPGTPPGGELPTPPGTPPGETPPPATPPGTTPPAIPGGAATAAGALTKLLSGGQMTAADWAALGIGAAGVAIPAIGGAISADKTADTIKGIYDTQRADRAPALAAYNNALANPDTFYNSAPATGALNGVLAKLSAQGGNPANNPGALSQAAAYNLGGYSNYLSGLAGPAFGGQATQAQLGSNLANAQGSQYAGVGYGLGTLLGNQSQPQYGLTIGGMRF